MRVGGREFLFKKIIIRTLCGRWSNEGCNLLILSKLGGAIPRVKKNVAAGVEKSCISGIIY